MGRLSANLSSLEHSMQSAHLRRQLTLAGKRLTAFCASLALLQNVFAATPVGEPRLAAPFGVASELIS